MKLFESTGLAGIFSALGPAGLNNSPVTQGLGTLAAVDYVYVNIGKLLVMVVTITAGTVTGSEAQVGLPAGMTSSASISSGRSVCGFLVKNAVDGNQNVILIEPSKTYVTFGTQGAAASGLTKIAGTGLVNNGGQFSFFAVVPLA